MPTQTTTYTPVAAELESIQVPVGSVTPANLADLTTAIKRAADGVAYAQDLAEAAEAATADLGTMADQDASAVNITGGTITGITDLAIADGGTGSGTASGARTNLGLGTIATQASNNVTITGGSITGITDLAVADGGTGSSTAGGARTNLGVGTGDSPSFNQVTTTVATGTAPLVVSSTTVVANLNASLLSGRTAGAASGVATLNASTRVVEPTAYTPSVSADWGGTDPVSDIGGLDMLASIVGPYLAHTLLLPDTASVMTNDQSLTGTMTDSASTAFNQFISVWRPSTAPPSFLITSNKLRITWNSTMSAQDIYSNGTISGPGIFVSISPYFWSHLRPGKSLYLSWTSTIDKPTSFNAAGEWARPLGMLLGPAAGDAGVRSWYLAFAEANTGVYRVGGAWCLGTGGNSWSLTNVASADLITGYDMRLRITWDGKVTFLYRSTAAGGAYSESAAFVNTPAFWPQSVFLGFGMGAVDAGAGTCTMDLWNGAISVE